MKLKKQIVAAVFLMSACLVFGQTQKTETAFKKACNDIANAFAKENIGAINKYIDADAGVYVISRPGAIDAFVNQKQLDKKKPFAIKYPYKDTSAVKKHAVSFAVAPKYNCGDMKWDKAGFVADTLTKYSRLSDLMNFLATNNGEKYTAAQIEMRDVVEKKMRKVVFTKISKNRGLVFYMSLLKGKWYLTMIDLTEGMCAG
jgi:hypothetical protein